MDDPSPPLSLRQRTRHRGLLAATAAIWLAYMAWRLVAARRGADPIVMSLDLAAESVLAVGFLCSHAGLVARPRLAPWSRPVDDGDATGRADVIVTSDGGSELELRAAVLAARRLAGVDRILVVDPAGSPGRRSIATSLDAAYLSGSSERSCWPGPCPGGRATSSSCNGRVTCWRRGRSRWHDVRSAGPPTDRAASSSHPSSIVRPGEADSRCARALRDAALEPWIDQPVVIFRRALADMGGFDPVETRLGTDLCLRAARRPLVPSSAPCYRDVASAAWRTDLIIAAERGRASRRVLAHHRLGWHLGKIPWPTRFVVWGAALTRAEAAARLVFAAVVTVVAITGRLPLVASATQLTVASVAVLGSSGLVSRASGSRRRPSFRRWRSQARRLGADLGGPLPRDTLGASAVLARRQASSLLAFVVLSTLAVAALYTPLHLDRPPALARVAIMAIAGLHLLMAHSAQRFLRSARLDAPLQVDSTIDLNFDTAGPVLAVSPIGLLTDQSAPEDASTITLVWRAEDGSARRRSVVARWADATDTEGRCWLLFDEPAVDVRDALLSYVALGQAFEAAFGTEVLPSPIAIEIGRS